jgi:putative ABC transport system substrate-binding protein
LITRRIAVVAGGLALLAAPLLMHGQPRSGAARIGFLWFSSMDDPASLRYRAAFRQRLRELGYVEDKNIVIEERSADGHPERLDHLARDLVASKVDVMVSAAVAATSAARRATRTIPIVMVNAGDPVGAGLIASLARPGGNVTGSTNLSFGAKQVELMHQLVPRAAKFAILLNPSNAGASRYIADATEAARSVNLSVAVVDVVRAEDFANAFATIREMRPDGLLVMTEPLIGGQRAQVIAFAKAARIPTSYDNANMVREGGLVSYGPLYVAHYVLAAGYVDNILKGRNPAELPVEQPTRFELVVNVKTAKALGLTLPPLLLQRADEVIQ